MSHFSCTKFFLFHLFSILRNVRYSWVFLCNIIEREKYVIVRTVLAWHHSKHCPADTFNHQQSQIQRCLWLLAIQCLAQRLFNLRVFRAQNWLPDWSAQPSPSTSSPLLVIDTIQAIFEPKIYNWLLWSAKCFTSGRWEVKSLKPQLDLLCPENNATVQVIWELWRCITPCGVTQSDQVKLGNNIFPITYVHLTPKQIYVITHVLLW